MCGCDPPFVNLTRSRSPSVARSVGPGIRPLYVHAGKKSPGAISTSLSCAKISYVRRCPVAALRLLAGVEVVEDLARVEAVALVVDGFADHPREATVDARRVFAPCVARACEWPSLREHVPSEDATGHNRCRADAAGAQQIPPTAASSSCDVHRPRGVLADDLFGAADHDADTAAVRDALLDLDAHARPDARARRDDASSSPSRSLEPTDRVRSRARPTRDRGDRIRRARARRSGSGGRVDPRSGTRAARRDATRALRRSRARAHPPRRAPCRAACRRPSRDTARAAGGDGSSRPLRARPAASAARLGSACGRRDPARRAA